jgi:hypothetical protein
MGPRWCYIRPHLPRRGKWWDDWLGRLRAKQRRKGGARLVRWRSNAALGVLLRMPQLRHGKRHWLPMGAVFGVIGRRILAWAPPARAGGRPALPLPSVVSIEPGATAPAVGTS